MKRFVSFSIVTALATVGVALAPANAGAREAVCTGPPGSTLHPGTPGNDILDGGPGIDVFNAGAGNDVITGFGGNDIICGGDGFDAVYYYDQPEAASGFTVDANLFTNTIVGTNGTDSVYDVEEVDGTDFRDRIIGDDARNDLYGGNGDDELMGLGANDRLYGDADNGMVNPNGSDVMSGGAGNDYLNGTGGPDVLQGDAGTDVLAGEAGNDLIDGGEGTDLASYACNYGSSFCVAFDSPASNPAGTGVTVDLKDSTQAGTAEPTSPVPAASVGTDTLTSVEGALGSDYADTLRGRPDAFDYFVPRGGNDLVDGRGDTSNPAGGDYVDYICEDVNELPCGGQGVTVDLASNSASGGQGNDTLLNIRHVVGSELDDRIIGDGANNELFGQAGSDHIEGGPGDDGVEGESGNDYLAGGAGTDKLRYTLHDCSNGVGVNVNLSGGTATGDGNDRIDRDDADKFEQVIGSTCNDSLTGSAGNDTLFGSGGSDTLYGRGGSDLLVPNQTNTDLSDTGEGANGNDSLYGGSGNDTVSYEGARFRVVADLPANIASEDGDGGQDGLIGVESVIGGPLNDTIQGDADANLLLGGPGSDTINGGGGDDYVDGESGEDVLDGGAGATDVVDYHYGSGGVVADLKHHTGDQNGEQDDLANFEAVGGTEAADQLTGNARTNFLFGDGGDDGKLLGSGGNDFLDGGSGKQRLVGGKGLDWCISGKPNDCEYRKSSGKKAPKALRGLRPRAGILSEDRIFRETGQEQIKKLEEALDAMRFHKLETPTG